MPSGTIPPQPGSSTIFTRLTSKIYNIYTSNNNSISPMMLSLTKNNDYCYVCYDNSSSLSKTKALLYLTFGKETTKTYFDITGSKYTVYINSNRTLSLS